MEKPKKENIPQHIINSLLTDVKLGGLNFHEVACLLHTKGWLSFIPNNLYVINLLYGNVGNYLNQCKQ